VAAPSRFIALLRAINVGGRTVRMEELRKVFDAMGFSSVETFIASGNVIFETTVRSVATLEKRIESQLRTSLGYEVTTFLRSPAELAEVVTSAPFAHGEADLAGGSLYVGFLRAAPSDDVREKVLALRTPVDELGLHGRELYWLARERMMGSKISNARLERVLGTPMTMRNISTVTTLAAKYTPRVGAH
jgi:uncharacterized protein (DUF1697 family)